MIIPPAALSLSISSPFSLLFAMCSLYPSSPFLSLSLSLPACLPPSLRGLNHPRFCLPCHVCPLRTSVQASSHGDGASRADISPQASDVHDASTDLSLTPQSTDIIKVGHIPAPKAINRQVWCEPHFHARHFQIRSGRRFTSFLLSVI